MSYQPNVQPICTEPQHGGLEAGLPPSIRLCTNPLHKSDPRNWDAHGDTDIFHPVWHRIAEWPK